MTTINFDTQLYDIKAVQEAAQVYQEWADFNIKETKKEIRVTIISRAGQEEEIIRDEFGNYVLALMKSLKS